MPILLKNKWW